VAPELAKQGEYVGGNPIPNDFYLGDPRVIGFTEHAKTIPVLIGTVMCEFAFGPGIAGKHSLSEDEVRPMIEKMYGDKSGELIELYKKAYPDKHLSDLLFIDSFFRLPTIDFIRKKAQHKEAPTYSYLFTYEFPFDDGKAAWHCSEIPFVFHNTDKVPICNEPGVFDKLERQIFGAWVSFAKYGNPNHQELPYWPECKENDEAVMIFDKKCEVRHNFDHELIDLHRKSFRGFFSENGTFLH